MTEPILGNKEWEDRTLEEKLERLLRVHDFNALALADVAKRVLKLERLVKSMVDAETHREQKA